MSVELVAVITTEIRKALPYGQACTAVFHTSCRKHPLCENNVLSLMGAPSQLSDQSTGWPPQFEVRYLPCLGRYHHTFALAVYRVASLAVD